MGESVNRQNGVVLVIALIALVAMSLAGIALMRTVDTSNVISGNLAFGEAAVQMEDVGEEAAYSWILGNLYGNPSGCLYTQANGAANCPNYYYPDVMPIDASTKLPSPGGGATINWSPAVTTGLPAGYSVQYIIERMCGSMITTGSWNTGQNTNGAVSTFTQCMSAPIYDSTQTPPIVSGKGWLNFRVTVMVSGPRNTTGLAQYFITQEDTVQ